MTFSASPRGRCSTSATDQALAYAEQGWRVLPLHTPAPGGCSCRRTDCSKPGKHPRTRRGVNNASTDPGQVHEWWRRWPAANVGIATGELVVIDVDHPDGRRALERLQREHERLPETLRARSARGEHVYFAAAGRAMPSSVGRIGAGLDVRGTGGYVVAPPSRHASGQIYTWSHRAPVAPLPGWLAHLLIAPVPPPATAAVLTRPAAALRARRYFAAALVGELERVAAAREGTRNDTLNCAAFRLGQLAGAGLGTVDELSGPLLDAALQAGLPRREAVATIRSGLQAGSRQPRDPRRRLPQPDG